MTGAAGAARRPEHERSIAAEARELHRRVGRETDPGAPFRTADPEGPAQARDRRRELYTLVAVCAETVVRDLVTEARPADVAATWEAAGRRAPRTPAAFNDLLLEAFDEFFTTHLSWWREDASGLEPLLARIDEIGPGVSSVLDMPRVHYAERLLQAGMRSMAPVAPAVLAAVATLAAGPGLDSSAAALAAVARRSARVAKQLAALGLGQSSDVQRQLIDRETLAFAPGAPIRVTADAKGQRLELDLAGLDVVAGPGLWPLSPAYDRVIGCPTLTPVGATSSFDRLWTWTIDLAVETGYLIASPEE